MLLTIVYIMLTDRALLRISRRIGFLLVTDCNITLGTFQVSCMAG